MSTILSTSLSVGSHAVQAGGVLPPLAPTAPFRLIAVPVRPLRGLHDLDALNLVVLGAEVVVVCLHDQERVVVVERELRVVRRRNRRP